MKMNVHIIPMDIMRPEQVAGSVLKRIIALI
jgi:hypothetical protein